MIKQKVIRYYTAKNSKVPIFDWLNNLKDRTAQTRIRQRVDRLELGLYGDYKVISGALCELRLNFGPGYRVYFAEQNNNITVFLCGGDKSTQSRDIETAKLYLADFKRRIENGSEN